MPFPHEHHYLLEDARILANARKSAWVLALTAGMMAIEIAAGFVTHSMALLADGWHMASHAAAMLISILAYRLGRSARVNQHLSFGAGKFIPLGGYTSALLLTMISVLMAAESVQRLFKPETIEFNEAIGIAALGLCVNLISAWILEGEHSHEQGGGHGHHHDHNLRSAYIHVLADALTSILAIFALAIGKFCGLNWMDSVVGVIGSIVILKWAYSLCRETASELLDVHSKTVPPHEIREFLEKNGILVLDVHTWRIAPSAIACELVIGASKLRGGDFYRELIATRFQFEHLIIEERLGR